MRRLALLSTVFLVVLAGCVGTPVSTRDVAPAEADLPPGVNATGVTNATALADAHDTVLRDTGFTLDGRYTRTNDRRNFTRSFEIAAAPDLDPVRIDTRSVARRRGANGTVVQRSRLAAWRTDSTVLVHTVVDGTPHTRPMPVLPASLAPTRAPQLESYLSIGDYTVDRVVERGGQTVTTLVATRPKDRAANVSFRARFVVDERGVVREAAVDIDAGEGDTEHARYRVDSLDGTVRPERPAWAVNVTA